MDVDEMIGSFIEDLLRAKGFSESDGAGWDMMKNDLTNKLMEQVNIAIVNDLSDEKLDELNRLTDKEGVSDEQLHDFFRHSGVDLERVIVETTYQFKALFLGEKTAEQLVDEKRSDYRARGVCQYCGGEFKGMFNKVCVKCKRQKDY